MPKYDESWDSLKRKPAANGADLRDLLRSNRISLVVLGVDLFQFYIPIYGHGIGLSASAIGSVLAVWHGLSSQRWPVPAAIAIYLVTTVGGSLYGGFVQQFVVIQQFIFIEQ